MADLPKRILFVGGGYISFEFAHVAAQAGAEVTILHRSGQPLKAFDDETSQALTEVRNMSFTKMQAINPDGSLTDWTQDTSTIQSQTNAMLNNMGVINLLFTR